MTAGLNDTFERYMLALRNTAADDQTEMTSRGALEALLNDAAREFAQGKVVVTHEPRRAQDKGAPDFKITSRGSILGYVETKAIGENLAKVAKSEQIKKYLTLSPNLLLTDYLHWMWITPHGVQEVRLAEVSALEGRTVRVQPARAHELQALLKGFYSQPPQKIGTAKALAEALATRSQLLRDFLGDELVRQDKAKQGGVLMGLYGAFKQQVSHEITLKEFADAFAQTLAYGLFLAKLNAKPTDTITLLNAKQFVPASVGLIQELVGFLDRLDQANYADIRWVVEEVLSIINNLELTAIHEDLAFRNRKARRPSDTRPEAERRLFSRDPFVYFYEDYLAKYDAKMRKSRGVYYTPPPVVNFIVRAINDTLKDTFGIAEGLADRNRVTVLDFATGTGTFLVEVLERIFEEIGGADSAKAPLVVRDHILKNIYGFEYLIAPYTIAHLKLSQYLRDKEVESGRISKDGSPNGEFGPKEGERFQVFLTNTLEPIEIQPNYLLPELSYETKAAQAVKEKPILVITGNPPYFGLSKNKGPNAKALIEKYKYVDGHHFEEKKHWLGNDYVKFMAFAEEKLRSCEEGLFATITDNSYLDNPTFRGMRQHLLNTFDQIYVLDLHGNVEKREKAPDGQQNGNVFDIKQGTSIAIFIKKAGLKKGIFHTDLWGSALEKYEVLAATDFSEVKYVEISPAPPYYFFKPDRGGERCEWDGLTSLTEIFSVYSIGIISSRDHLLVGFNQSELQAKLNVFGDPSRSDEEISKVFAIGDNYQWKVSEARRKFAFKGFDPQLVEPFHYLPFDTRCIYLDDQLVFRARRAVTDNLLIDNVALLTDRITHDDPTALVAASAFGHKSASRYDPTYGFPLFVRSANSYEAPSSLDMFSEGDFRIVGERTENIIPGFRKWLNGRYNASPQPEQLFGYIYAVLHAPVYRSAYADFLRTDFPRIPFPEALAGFEALAALGWELAETHLMRRPPPGGLALGGYVGTGSHEVEKPRWSEAEQKVWINKTQGFADVPKEVWEFTIGGYQVIDKYLKSRKGRMLSLDEIENVEKVTNILAFTIARIEAIDTAYIKAFLADSEAEAGEDDIHSDPEVMGGAPVFRGTRVPVRTVAEMMEAGADAEEVLQGYPSLNAARLELARQWVKENPSLRNPSPEPNFQPKVISRKRLPRRTPPGADGSGRKASA